MGDTSFLFAKPSFIEGFARIIDLGTTLDEYNESITPEQADFLAIRNDWEVIGKDIVIAFEDEEKKLDIKGQQIELEFGQI
jgi:hypothetical protein